MADPAAPAPAPAPNYPLRNAVRLACFVLVLSVFFAVARQGVASPILYTLFALYIVVATLWVRGLDEAWMGDHPEQPSVVTGLLIAAIPLVVSVGTWLLSGRPTATLLIGVVLAAYVGAGLLVRHLRWQASGVPGTGPRPTWLTGRRRVALASLVVVICAVGGLLLLGRVLVVVPLLLLAVPVVLAPALVHLMSELTIRRLVTAPAGVKAVYAVGGLVLLAVVGTLAWVLPQSRLPVVFLVVAALLVLALAAGSLGDVAVLLAVLALMGVSPASVDEPSVMTRDGGPTMVALGDSYLSGEGASRFIAGTNEGGGNQCRRAATAWPVLVTQQVDGLDRLVFRACSGAQAVNIREKKDGALPPRPREQHVGEDQQITRALDELDGETPSLVVLSIGGNDAGFSQIGMTCLALGDCDDAEPSGYFTGNNLERVRNRLRQTYREVLDRFGSAPVVVVPYPDPVAGNKGCPSAPLGDGDVRFITEFLGRLDGMIDEERKAYGFYYAGGMRGALATAHLQLCNAEGNEPGLNFLDLRSVGGVGGQRFNPLNWQHNSLHPNERGHAAMAAAFEAWLAEQGGLSELEPAADRQDSPSPGVAESTPGTPRTDCAAFGANDEDGCRARANRWALQTTGLGLLPLMGVGLFGVLGAWLVAVAAMAWRRT